jgi:Flp pilus assembly protein TadD
VLALAPNSAHAHHSLGVALLGRNAAREASEAFAAALSLKPDYAQALNSMGVAHQVLGNRLAAASCFEQALQLQPGSEYARRNLEALRSANTRSGFAVEVGIPANAQVR